jgi:ABC-type multidrug transport system fused ATPase/permease subunit
VQDKKALVSTMAEESFSNVRTVKAFANEREEIRKFKVENDEMYKIAFKRALVSGGFQCFANFFFYGSVGSILLVGGLLC